MNFMRINGTPVRRVEGHFLDCPGKGRMLVVNFLPSAYTFSHGIKAVEENVQMILHFLVRKRLTRKINWLQLAVNVEDNGRCHVLTKYYCDENKLRELEKHRSLFSKSIVKMPFGDIVSGSLTQGVPIKGFPEWSYVIGNRRINGIDVNLHRMGESAARFSLSLCDAEPIPVRRLDAEVAQIEYEIQRELNATLYALTGRIAANGDGAKVFGSKEPNGYVLRHLRTFALEAKSATSIDWVLPGQKVMPLIDILKLERIRVLSIQRFSHDESNGTWHEDGVVWKTEDMCSPTKQRVADSLVKVQSTMEHEFMSNDGNDAYHFVFDCRMLRSQMES